MASICLVDDDDAVREALALLLRTDGYDVQTYGSAQGLFTDLRIDSYACIVLDVHMPGITGVEILELLRGRHIGIPVVIMTGLAQAAFVGRIRAAGAAVLIEKPFAEDELLAAIRRACDGAA